MRCFSHRLLGQFNFRYVLASKDIRDRAILTLSLISSLNAKKTSLRRTPQGTRSVATPWNASSIFGQPTTAATTVFRERQIQFAWRREFLISRQPPFAAQSVTSCGIVSEKTMHRDLAPRNPFDKLIVAVDVASAVQAETLTDSLVGICRWIKIGLELYTAKGPEIVKRIEKKGFQVFLDLKLHEIPNSVRGAVESAARVGASMVTVHASGGPKMMDAAVEACRDGRLGIQVLAVTVPTSMDHHELRAVGIESHPLEHVLRLAALAESCGVHGIVCSPRESAHVRKVVSNATRLVIPGIRPSDYPADDQSRISTLAEAIANGADYVVVGRPITRDIDPAKRARSIQREIAKVAAGNR